MGNLPRVVAIGDFNGDGIQDVAASVTSGLALALGRGEGRFGPPKIVDTLQIFLEVGDFDSDGKDDLVGVSATNTVTFLINFTGVIFNNRVSSDVGDDPIRGVSGDFNGDGKLDLAVANRTSDDVSIILGNGLGQFFPQIRSRIGSNPSSIAIGDFNEDGISDLAVSNISFDNVSVVLGAGDGSFSPPAFFPAGDSPRSISVADFDENGHQDLVVVNPFFSGQLSLLRGAGDGTFGSPEEISFAPGKRPRSIVIGDFDNDGHRDVAGVSDFLFDVSVVYGKGDGTFRPEIRFRVGRFPNHLAIGDLDGTPGQDLAVSNLDGDNISLLLNNGDGTFPQESRKRVGERPSSIIESDFNEDGKEDLAVSNLADSTVSVLLGRGDGLFFGGTVGSVDLPGSLAAGDFDGDGHQDFAVVNLFTGIPREVLVSFGSGFGTFPRTLKLEVPDIPRKVVAGDFNGDGKDDMAVTMFDLDVPALSGVSVFLGREDGTFGPENRFPAGQRSFFLKVGDFDENGIPDLVVANIVSDDLSVLLGFGDGTFATVQTIPLGDSAGALEVGDFNNDSHLDFAVPVPVLRKIMVFRGLGNGTFFPTPVTKTTPRGIIALSAGDFDLDGNLDLVSFFEQGSQFEGLSLWPGRGNGFFDPEIRFEVGFDPLLVLGRDLNGDDRPDVIFSNGFNDISILINSPPRTDIDRDGFPDLVDNCPKISNPDQGDLDLDEVGDPCDNCVSISNTLQENSDGDRFGDVCDPCPLDISNDLDRDGLCADVDPCPVNSENDQDGDGFCEDVDNCPLVHNPLQEDSNADDAGDACQPFVSIEEIVPVAGNRLLARVRYGDPVGERVRVTASLKVQGDPLVLGNFLPDLDCSNTLFLDLGEGVVLVYIPLEDSNLILDLFLFPVCPDANSNVLFAFGNCENLEGPFSSSGFLDIASQDTPFDLCVRTFGDPFDEITLTIEEFGLSGITFVNPFPKRVTHVSFFDADLPEINLSPLSAGEEAFLTLTVTDFRTPQVQDTVQFPYGGESFLVFQIDGIGFSEGSLEVDFQCNSASGSTVILNASGVSVSSGPGETDGNTNQYDWFEDFGSPSQIFLGSGILFPAILDFGTHEVTLRVTEESGSVHTEFRMITVLDTLAPELSVPPDRIVECAAAEGTPFDPGAVSAVDACFGPVSVSGNNPGIFPLGITELAWTAQDPLGNAVTQTQIVQVQDTVPPTLILPAEKTVECNGPDGTSVDLDIPFVADACSDQVTVSNDAPILFPLGSTDVTWTAQDQFGNLSTLLQMISVVDTTAPNLFVDLDPLLLWPPNHRLVDIEADVTASDACGGASVILESVTSDEPDDAEGLGDGRTVNDIRGNVEGILDTKFQLRAERAGDGPGRNYTVTYLAVDDQGIPHQSVTEIFVPHDQGGVLEPLILAARKTEAGTRLDWSPVPEARFYNAIRGEMSGIREHKDYFHLGKGKCVGSRLTDPTKVVMEDPAFPAIGEVYFYLVEYDDGRRSGFGTVTAAKERFLPSGLGNCP